MMDCKRYMCQLFLAVDKLAVDYCLSRIVQIYRNFEDHESQAGRHGNDVDVGESVVEEILETINGSDFSFDVECFH